MKNKRLNYCVIKVQVNDSVFGFSALFTYLIYLLEDQQGGSGKKYWGQGLAPHHLGGNNG